MLKLSELSKALSEKGFPNHLEGNADLEISAVNTLELAQKGDISFLSNSRYKNKLQTTNAGAVIVTLDEKTPECMTVIRCSDPYAAITATIIIIHGYRKHPQWGVAQHSTIADSAQIGKNANIGPYVTISANAVIGDNVTIYPGCYIGDDVTIGNNIILYPNVVIYDQSKLGDNIVLQAGTVIGQDGLGFAKVDGDWLKIPQIGYVVVADEVEMGANCAVDRATVGITHIGKGSKFSDLVVIGHGTNVGKRCMLVAQVGIAGSVNVGDDVTMGGQVGVAGHLNIGDNVLIHAKSAVWSSLDADTHYLGYPATQTYRYRRQAALVQRLPDINKRLRKLEAELERLRESRT